MLPVDFEGQEYNYYAMAVALREEIRWFQPIIKSNELADGTVAECYTGMIVYDGRNGYTVEGDRDGDTELSSIYYYSDIVDICPIFQQPLVENGFQAFYDIFLLSISDDVEPWLEDDDVPHSGALDLDVVYEESSDSAEVFMATTDLDSGDENIIGWREVLDDDLTIP